MVTIKDIEQVLTMVRNKGGLRVIIRLRKSRNMIALEKEIRALSLRVITWPGLRHFQHRLTRSLMRMG